MRRAVTSAAQALIRSRHGLVNLRSRSAQLQVQTRGLQGLMMQEPLLISSLIRHADRHHPDGEIVSRRAEGDGIHRYTYRDCHRRSKRVANVLGKFGIGRGERVGTLALNGYRHMELYFGVSGSGAVLHTLNPRLFLDHIVWIINHAEDKMILFDVMFLPLVEKICQSCPTVKHWVALTDPEHMPAHTSVPGLLNYEQLLQETSDVYRWPGLDENAASSLCYTSGPSKAEHWSPGKARLISLLRGCGVTGTTGNPKGVLYSHRSTVLHSYAVALPDSLNLSARDSVCTVVPLFHVNAWGLPYAAALVGCKLVFPGAAMDGKSLYELIEAEKVTVSAGVPTVWLGLLNHVRQVKGRFSSMTRTVVGGAACPPVMLRSFLEDYDVQVLHAWGMTEMSPLGTSCTLKHKHLSLPRHHQYDVLYKQGRAIYGVDMMLLGEDGQELPWDGKTYGELLVRGPWIISDYFKAENAKDVMHIDSEGKEWFPTGDVATIDPDGFMQITDRSKDVIKSGGEWISSIDLENIAIGHPAVQMAAVIGVFHPKWDERPLLIVVKREGTDITKEELLRYYEGKVAKWWMPDDVVFTDTIPLGATGKMLKNKLREQFKDHCLPSAGQDTPSRE